MTMNYSSAGTNWLTPLAGIVKSFHWSVIIPHLQLVKSDLVRGNGVKSYFLCPQKVTLELVLALNLQRCQENRGKSHININLVQKKSLKNTFQINCALLAQMKSYQKQEAINPEIWEICSSSVLLHSQLIKNWSFSLEFSLPSFPFLGEVFLLRSDIQNIKHWHAAVSIHFHFLKKCGAEILSRQISIFTHDCQIWLPSVKGMVWETLSM